MNSTSKKSKSKKSADVSVEELFPHDQFPFRLDYTDGKEKKVCWFQTQHHLEKHLERYHLTTDDCIVRARDGIITSTEKKPKRTKKEQKLFSTLDDFFA